MVYFEAGFTKGFTDLELKKELFSIYKGWEKTRSKEIRILRLKKDKIPAQQIEARKVFTYPHYHKFVESTPGGIRTPSLTLRTRLLYPLSYGRKHI